MKRLSFAAFITTSVVLLSNATPAEALGHRAIPQTKTSSISHAIASSARGVASSMSSVGYCYRGVKRALKRVGVTLVGGEAYQAKNQLANNERFHQVSLSNLQTGDILVHGASAAHPHGHIAVYLGNGKEASDHIGRLITGRRYGGTTVWRARPDYAIASGNTKPAAEKAPVVAAALPAVVTPMVPSTVSPVVLDLTPQPVATAPTAEIAQAPAAPKALDLSSDISTALMQMIQMAQSAQINLTQALQEAVGAIS